MRSSQSTIRGVAAALTRSGATTGKALAVGKTAMSARL